MIGHQTAGIPSISWRGGLSSELTQLLPWPPLPHGMRKYFCPLLLSSLFLLYLPSLSTFLSSCNRAESPISPIVGRITSPRPSFPPRRTPGPAWIFGSLSPSLTTLSLALHLPFATCRIGPHVFCQISLSMIWLVSLFLCQYDIPGEIRILAPICRAH